MFYNPCILVIFVTLSFLYGHRDVCLSPEQVGVASLHRAKYTPRKTEYTEKRKSKAERCEIALDLVVSVYTNESRTVYSNHARGVYIIKPQVWISPTQSVVYHHCERKYSPWLMIYTFGDDILAFSRYARKKRMIYQVCDLDKKITVFKEAVIFWWTVAPFAHRGLRGKLGFCYSSVGHDE